MGVPLAVGLQVLSSVLFASGAILQSLAVRADFDPNAQTSENQLSFGGLLRQFTKPRWLLGLVCVLAGAGLHIFALTMAPVAVVQPIGILAVPWSVLIASRIHKHKIPGSLWTSVALTIVGVVGFTVIAGLFTQDAAAEFHMQYTLIAFAVAVVVCLVLSFAAVKGAAWSKALLWSSVGAVFYGLASGMMKSALNLLQHEGAHFFSVQVLTTAGLMIVCYILGVWMIQQGYASGAAEITVGTMTVVDPFVAVLFGLVVLGEGHGMGVLPGIGMAVFFALSVFGVARLSRDHPEAVEERRKAAEKKAEAPQA